MHAPVALSDFKPYSSFNVKLFLISWLTCHLHLDCAFLGREPDISKIRK